jgi:hypothetical protein
VIGDGYFIYVCPECGNQSRGPGAHRMAGDDSCQGPRHAEDARTVRLMRVEVKVADEGTSSLLWRARRRRDQLELEWRRARGFVPTPAEAS